MSDHIILGIQVGNGRVAVKGRPARDEFELISALYLLLRQASASDELGEGGFKGAIVGEPRLNQGMTYQNENLPVTIGGRHFRISVKTERS